LRRAPDRGLLLRRQDAVLADPRGAGPAPPRVPAATADGQVALPEHARALLRPRPGRGVRRTVPGPVDPRAPDAREEPVPGAAARFLAGGGRRRGRHAPEDVLRGGPGQREEAAREPPRAGAVARRLLRRARAVRRSHLAPDGAPRRRRRDP